MLPSQITTREYDKFKETVQGTTVKVAVTEGSVTGSFTFSGLSIGGLVTHIALTDAAWTALPATPLASRNTLTIQNVSDNGNIILWNYSASAPATEGFRVTDGGFKSVMVGPTIIIYGRMLAGSGTVACDEVA